MKNVRIIDANINRICEGIRVIEDIFRFVIEQREITNILRNIRHQLRMSLQFLDEKMILSRDSDNDIGTHISKQTAIDNKQDNNQLVKSNFKRAQEGLRVIEENLKIIGYNEKSKEIEHIRFDLYTLEKRALSYFKKEIPLALYGITDFKSSNGKSNAEIVRIMVENGIRIIQYREKHKSLLEKYEECKEIRRITRAQNAIFIVNDHIDIALLVDADGVHLGQDDIPISEARTLLPNKIIGVSTHSPTQAQKAIQDGADYIGVGPIFQTNTKENVCDPVGLEYLEYAIKNVSIPFVAIGGIKEHNLNQIVTRGAKRIALVTEITGADNIKQKIKSLNKIINGE